MNLGAFRDDAKRWIPAAIFAAVNLVAFLAYVGIYAQRADRRGEALSEREILLDELRAERERLDALVESAQWNREAVGRFYSEALATEEERLTGLLTEVKELARRAGLAPSDIAYPKSRVEGFPLVERRIVFRVDGDYQALRRFLNLLELSDRFVILDEVRLTGDDEGSGQLKIGLELAALFAEEERPAPPGAMSS